MACRSLAAGGSRGGRERRAHPGVYARRRSSRRGRRPGRSRYMSAPTYVSARVDGEGGVAAALKALREVGVPRERVEVLSDLPLPASILGGEMRATRVPLFTAVGLVGGLAAGVFFSVGTLFPVSYTHLTLPTILRVYI